MFIQILIIFFVIDFQTMFIFLGFVIYFVELSIFHKTRNCFFINL